MSKSQFIEDLRTLPRRHPFYATLHPFWRMCFRGQLSIEELRGWACDIYPFVREFARSYIFVATKCDSVRGLTFLGETIFEETGSGKPSEAHSLLLKNFINAIGVPDSEIPELPPTPEARAICEYTWKTAREGSFIEGLSCLGLGIERPLPGFFPLLAKALIKHYGLTERDVWFFELHGAADIKHSNLAASILEEEATSETDRQRVKDVAWKLWDLQLAHIDALLARHEQSQLIETA